MSSGTVEDFTSAGIDVAAAAGQNDGNGGIKEGSGVPSTSATVVGTYRFTKCANKQYKDGIRTKLKDYASLIKEQISSSNSGSITDELVFNDPILCEGMRAMWDVVVNLIDMFTFFKVDIFSRDLVRRNVTDGVFSSMREVIGKCTNWDF